MADIDIDVILMAGRYSLLDRSAVEQLLPLCEKRGTSITAGGVFNSGILATGPIAGAHFDYTPASEDVLGRVRAMEEIAHDMGKPLAQFALQFPLHHPAVASVIIGTARPESLNRNMALTHEELPTSAFTPFDQHTLETTMLKGIHPLLGPDLLHAIATMGHGDEIVIADGNFPASTLGPPVVRADGVGAVRVLE
eukprot:gene68519-93887_t